MHLSPFKDLIVCSFPLNTLSHLYSCYELSASAAENLNSKWSPNLNAGRGQRIAISHKNGQEQRNPGDREGVTLDEVLRMVSEEVTTGVRCHGAQRMLDLGDGLGQMQDIIALMLTP